MSDIDSSEGIAAGTAQIMDGMVPGAYPSSREHDGRDAGDIGSARAGVDLLFASIGFGLCPDGSVLKDDRNTLLWNAVEQLRSQLGRLKARLESRLQEPTPEQREQRAQDNDADGNETDYLLAHGVENTKQQIGVLEQILDHALNRYGEVVGAPGSRATARSIPALRNTASAPRSTPRHFSPRGSSGSPLPTSRRTSARPWSTGT